MMGQVDFTTSFLPNATDITLRGTTVPKWGHKNLALAANNAMEAEAGLVKDLRKNWALKLPAFPSWGQRVAEGRIYTTY